jgi:hypothetical protein
MEFRYALGWLALTLPTVVLVMLLLFRRFPRLAPSGYRKGQAQWVAASLRLRLANVLLSVVRVGLVVLVLEWANVRGLDWLPVAQVGLGLLLTWIVYMVFAEQTRT